MKLYDQDQMTGYSITHPRGWKKVLLESYFEMKGIKVSLSDIIGVVPTVGNLSFVVIEGRKNALKEVRNKPIYFRRTFMKDKYYNLRDRDILFVETKLYVPTYYSGGDDMGLSYHLNGGRRYWSVEKELEVKL